MFGGFENQCIRKSHCELAKQSPLYSSAKEIASFVRNDKRIIQSLSDTHF